MGDIDLLLINPSYIKKGNLFRININSSFERCPPLGLGYLASNCIHHNFNVELIDLDIEHLTSHDLSRKISILRPKLIGISCLSPLVSIVIKLTRFLKEKFNIPIVLGGPHTNIDPESLLNENSIDFLIRGEGEIPIVELLNYIIKKEGELKNIKNLSFKRDDKIIHNPLRELKSNLDEYPFPNRSLFKTDLYFNPFTRGKRFFTLITSRGCPFRCIFCNPIYRKSRKRSVKNVIEEIKKEVKYNKIHNFEIFDETFNFPPDWVIKFCNEIIKSKLKISFRIRCRPDLIVSEEMTQKLKDAGCYIISLGIESANDKTLEFLKKIYNSAQIKKAIELIKNAKIKIHGFFILGTPTETKREMLNTINFAIGSKIDFAIFALLTPFPGTELYEMANKRGWWDDKNKLDYSDLFGQINPILKHPELSNKELIKLHRKAYIKFYLRFRAIRKLIGILIYNPLYPFKVLKYQFK